MSTELTVTISEEQITRRFLLILVPPFLACMSPADICAKVATASSNPTAGTPRLRSSIAGRLAADRNTSLEDRYGSFRLDVLIHTYWSQASGAPLLTVSALRASRHLARAWPADLPLRRSSQVVRSTAILLVSAGFLVVCLPVDGCGFCFVLARDWRDQIGTPAWTARPDVLMQSAHQ
jgi:hypothetical protein